MSHTILKMAKKRAYVDAVSTATGVSDVFTQDIEDSPEVFQRGNGAPPDAPPLRQPQAKVPPTQAPPAQGQPEPGYISEPQRKRLFAITRECRVDPADLKIYLLHNHGDESTSKIRREDYDDVIGWVQTQKSDAAV